MILENKMHKRFNRKVWTFKHDFTGSLAKWLIRQSPYTVPDNLAVCVEKFHAKLDELGTFDSHGMLEIELSSLTAKMGSMLESIPEIMELNERKNGREGNGFTSRHAADPEPDDDFICIGAVAQNITCDFAEHVDAEAWLDKDKLTQG